MSISNTSRLMYHSYGMLQLSRGLVNGVSYVNKFGENSVIAGDAVEEVWDGSAAYSYPATALITSMSQTADQLAMRGANIEIQGLDANWELVVQTASLDATLTTNVVTLDTPLIRVFRMKVMANVVSTSPIRCHNAAESQDYAIIQSGNNQTLMALYTVPLGKTAYMVSYFGDVVPNTNKEPIGTEFTLWVADRSNEYEFQLKHEKGVPQYSAGFQHYFAPYMKITEKSDIKIKAQPYAEEGHVHAGFDLILVNNT